MRKPIIIGLVLFCGVLFFNCGNDPAFPIEEPGSISVGARAIPVNAIELTTTDGYLIAEGGKDYIVGGEVEAIGFPCTIGNLNNTTLYVEGSLTLYGSPDGELIFPDEMTIVIVDGGSLIIHADRVFLGGSSTLFLEQSGRFMAVNSSVSYRDSTSAGIIVNHGYMEIAHLILGNTFFYNMVSGNGVFCTFSSNGKNITNYGMLLNCERFSYDY